MSVFHFCLSLILLPGTDVFVCKAPRNVHLNGCDKKVSTDRYLVTALLCPVLAAFMWVPFFFLWNTPPPNRFPWQHNRKVIEQMFILSRPVVWLTVDPEHVCSCCTEWRDYRFPCFSQNLLMDLSGVPLCTLLQVYPRIYTGCVSKLAVHILQNTPYLEQQQLPLYCLS